MDVLNLLSSAASDAVGVLLIVVPLLLYRWLMDSFAHWPPYGAMRKDKATIAGFLLGICLVAVTPLPGQPLSFDSIFNRGGPWDFGMDAFCDLVLDRTAAAPRRLLDGLILDDERLNLTLGVAVAAALLTGDAITGFFRLRWRRALAGVFIDLIVAALTAVLTIYAAMLVLWLCNRLNFWLFLVGILAIQEYRYNLLGLFPRHRRFRLPSFRLPH